MGGRKYLPPTLRQTINNTKDAEIDIETLKNTLPTVNDLEKLDFESVILIDKRDNLQFALDTLRNNHPIGIVFFKHSLEGAPIYSVVVIFTELYLNIALSAFFVEDDDIENKDEPPTFESISRRLLTSLWVYTTTKLCFFFVNFFVPCPPKEEQIISKSLISNTDNTTIKLYNALRTKERPTMLIFLAICIALNGLATYFLVIFTSIYAQSTVVWFNNVLTTLLLEYAVILMIIPYFLISSRMLSRIFPSTLWMYKLALSLKNTTVGADILGV